MRGAIEDICPSTSVTRISKHGLADYDQILHAVKLLMNPGDVHELRIPKTGRMGTISGYFDHPEQLARAAVDLDGQYPGVYMTLNPTKRELLARACNRIKSYAQVTSADQDILQRRWLLIDCDPKRPAGISSSDAEHSLAITTACAIRDDLHSVGWPDPVVADSGNGSHLLYRIDAPNTAKVTVVIQQILVGIAAHCAPADISVDLAVYNAARISKVYGTMARKGDSTPDRPHRRSRLLEVPDDLQVLHLEDA